MSIDALLDRYRGIEGRRWPEDPTALGIELESGLASLSQFNRVCEYAARIGRDLHVDLLFISADRSMSALQDLPSQLRFVGYDIGSWESDLNAYSVLLNEVIFGEIPELTRFVKNLNENLLLLGTEQDLELLHARQRLVSGGADLESFHDDERIGAIRVHAPVKRGRQLEGLY